MDMDMEPAAKANVPCVGLLFSGYWLDAADLASFRLNMPPHFTRYGSILLRRAPNKHDENGMRTWLPCGKSVRMTMCTHC